jgi:hypothetical protein
VPDNVLDKSAMATLARLENELPHIGEALKDLAEAQKESTFAMNQICKNLAVVTVQCQRNTDDIKVHNEQIGTVKDDVAGLKVTNKIVGSANALWTAVAATLAAVFGGN